MNFKLLNSLKMYQPNYFIYSDRSQKMGLQLYKCNLRYMSTAELEENCNVLFWPQCNP